MCVFHNLAIESGPGLGLDLGLKPRPLPRDQDQYLQKLDSSDLETRDLTFEIIRL